MEILCPVCGEPLESVEMDDVDEPHTMTVNPCGHEVWELLVVR